MSSPRKTPGQDPAVLAWRSGLSDVDDLYVDVSHTPGPDPVFTDERDPEFRHKPVGFIWPDQEGQADG